MTAIISLLIVLTLSLLITRLATAALTLTGLSQELAKLQSISAFTGVGFTTRESERMVQHPARRKILILLMILGNAGIVTAISSLVLSLVEVRQTRDWLQLAAWLVGGVGLLWLVATNARLERRLAILMRWILSRWTRLEAHDYAGLLHLTEDYRVRECSVGPDDWVAGQSLSELRLLQEGITVLGIHRANGDYVGVPRGETVIRPHDRLVLYGDEQSLDELDTRQHGSAGDAAHRRGVEDTQRSRASQQQRDRPEE
jgi:K+/H+ antiporter YhaU regulatory subunit KhtT